MKSVVLSFFDYTGNAVQPWADAGYECYCFDILHDQVQDRVEKVGNGSIAYCYADLTPGSGSWDRIRRRFAGRHVVMCFSFPPCTDLAGSGARHWESKAKKDPYFQTKAAHMASYSTEVADELGSEYIVENPVGALARLWRNWDYTFNPCDFGGYLPEDDVHPRWPEYIPPRDAYTKKTCIWVSKGVVWPESKPVEPEVIEKEYVARNGVIKVMRASRQTMMLGGKSAKTKRIRDEGPRGFLQAFFEANHAPLGRGGCR